MRIIRLLQRRRRLSTACLLVVASIGSGYLWAVLFGRGLSGGKPGYALENDEFPDANAASIAATFLLFGATFFWAFACLPENRKAFVRWSTACAIGGAAVFGLSEVVR